MTNPKTLELRAMIAGAMLSNPQNKTAALEACRWRLRGPQGQFVGLNRMRCAFVPESAAVIFDGRDNEEIKLATYERELGPLSVEILQPCEC